MVTARRLREEYRSDYLSLKPIKDHGGNYIDSILLGRTQMICSLDHNLQSCLNRTGDVIIQERYELFELVK